MAITYGRLRDVAGAADPISVLQEDLEILTEEGNKIVATYQSGSPNTVIGPPTSGTFILNQRWIDSLGAWWRCTVAGTPGTWRQETPAVVATPPSSGTIPSGYLIADAADNFALKHHAGSYTWRPVHPLLNYLQLTGLTGGIAGKLDFVVTTGLPAGIVLGVTLNNAVYFYVLTAGTDTEDSPRVIRPDDYNASTNAKVWKLQSNGDMRTSLAGGTINPNRLIKIGADANHVIQCSATTDIPLGVIQISAAVGSEDSVVYAPFGSSAGQLRVELGGTVSFGDFLQTDANGKATALLGAAGTYYIIGRALQAGVSGDVINFDPCVATQRVV